MKKLLSLALALIMVLTLSVAVAAEDTTYQDVSSVTIDVTYEATNTGTTSPAETFSFTIANTDVTHAADGVTKDNMPTPEVSAVEFAAGDAGNASTMTKTVTIDLPTYTSVGIYTYTITPTPGTTAGVTYWARPIKLVVTVIEQDGKVRVAAVHTEDGYDGTAADGTKSDDITYTYSAGSLSVSKTVAGNLGDRTKYFAITVTLTGEGDKTYAATYPVTGGSKLVNGTDDAAEATIPLDTPTTFYLKHGETFTISNLPYGVTYTVTEADYTSEGYDEENIVYSDNANKKIDSATDTVTITNTKGTTVDTGVVLDSLPYILLIAVAVVGVVAFTAKKRTTDR